MTFLTSSKMPMIDFDALRETLSDDELEIARGIVSTRGANAGRLRASRPKLARGADYETARHAGEVAFVWRHVAFMVSPDRRHSCMPCLDSAYLVLPEHIKRADWRERSEYRKAYERRLMDLAGRIVDTVAPESQYGVQRWGRALGML